MYRPKSMGHMNLLCPPYPQDCDNASRLVPGLWQDESRNCRVDEKYIRALVTDDLSQKGQEKAFVSEDFCMLGFYM